VSAGLFSRDEVLGGLPARRARTLLYLIEARTARERLREGAWVNARLSGGAAEERELALLEAYTLGRTPHTPVRAQDLERFAPRWAELVPENPRIRAATARAMAEKYRLPRGRVPALRAALGLDEPAVAEAYRALYGEPLEALYAPRTGAMAGLRWAWLGLGRRLEALPPAWTVFGLTFTETVGAGILALPIALATLGPVPGALLLVGVGLVNVLTVGYMSEAVARNGLIRYGNGFIGRVVEDYLGRAGSLILTAGLAAICALVLVAYYIGLATVMQDALGIPPLLGTAAVFLFGLYFATRRSLDLTMTSALVVGAVNLVLIVVLSVMALAQASPANLAYVNPAFLDPARFDPASLELVIGVVICAYFGHLSVSNCARTVLARDPGARSLILGSMSAQVVVMVLYCVWVVAVSGAVSPQQLAATPGTALGPLAEAVGPAVYVVGGIFAALGMGMASIHYALGLTNITRERLPVRRPRVVGLARSAGRLVLSGRADSDSLVLRYLGPRDAAARLALDAQLGEARVSRIVTVLDRWDSGALAGDLPGPVARRLPVGLQLLRADADQVLLRFDSPLAMRYEGPLPEGAAGPPAPPAEAGRRLAPLGERGRELAALAPVFLVFLATEWLFLTGSESFTKPLNFVGVIVVSLLGGVFPALLLIASRHKGDRVPAMALRQLGRPQVTAAVLLLSLAVLVLHGTIVWHDPVERALALGVSGLIMAVTLHMVRRGLLKPRMVVELRAEPGGRATTVAVHADGRPAEVAVRAQTGHGEAALDPGDGTGPPAQALRRVVVDLPDGPLHDLKVWVHQLRIDQDSEPWPARAALGPTSGPGRATEPAGADGTPGSTGADGVPCSGPGGTAVLPLSGSERHVSVSVGEAAPAAPEPPAAAIESGGG
jgi:amino acid permease